MSKMISYTVINNTFQPTKKAYKKARFKRMLSRAIKRELRIKDE